MGRVRAYVKAVKQDSDPVLLLCFALLRDLEYRRRTEVGSKRASVPSSVTVDTANYSSGRVLAIVHYSQSTVNIV